MKQARCWFEAGRLCWKPIRDSVMVLRAQGYRVELEEGSGWFSRMFIARGDDPAIRALADWVNKNAEAHKPEQSSR